MDACKDCGAPLMTLSDEIGRMEELVDQSDNLLIVSRVAERIDQLLFEKEASRRFPACKRELCRVCQSMEVSVDRPWFIAALREDVQAHRRMMDGE